MVAHHVMDHAVKNNLCVHVFLHAYVFAHIKLNSKARRKLAFLVFVLFSSTDAFASGHCGIIQFQKSHEQSMILM